VETNGQTDKTEVITFFTYAVGDYLSVNSIVKLAGQTCFIHGITYDRCQFWRECFYRDYDFLEMFV